MLLVSVGLCAAFLTVAVLTRSTIGAVLSGILLVLLSLPLMQLMLFVAGICLAVIGGIVCWRTERRMVRAGVIGGAIALCFAPFLSAGYRNYRLAETLRPQYPYVSLVERVKATAPPIEIQDEEGKEIQAEWPDPQEHYAAIQRQRSIRILHRSATYHFLNASQFGVGRMAIPSIRSLEVEPETPIELAELDNVPGQQAIDGDRLDSSVNRPEFHEIAKRSHFKVAHWFASPESLGDVKDVTQVAGFRSHAITREDINAYEPEAAPKMFQSAFEPRRWGKNAELEMPDFQVKHLELVGLLYHDTPIAYTQETLPELASSDSAPTRPLDEFESAGLEALQSGTPIFIEQQGDVVRVLGGLRNAESCKACHEGSSSKLLGAFSYTLAGYEPSGS